MDATPVTTARLLKIAQLFKMATLCCFTSATAAILIAEISFRTFGKLDIGTTLLGKFNLIVEIAVVVTGLLFAAILIRSNTYLRKAWLPAIAVTLATFLFALLSYRYRPLLNIFQFEVALLIACLLAPSIVLTVSIIAALRGIGRNLTLFITVLCLLVVGAGLFQVTSLFAHNREDSLLIKRLKTAHYTYYLPDHSKQAKQPEYRLAIYTEGVDFAESTVIIAKYNKLTDNQTPTLQNIFERPRKNPNNTSSCGQELITTYLVEAKPSDYTCTKVGDSSNGPIYEVSYIAPNEAQNTQVKDYVLLTDTTYVYATFHTPANVTPRIYNRDASVKLLQTMKPATPDQFVKNIQ